MKKYLLTILSIVCAISMALGFVGCGLGDDNNDETTHTHTYSENYSSDETYHWYQATCEHTDLVDKKGEHTFDEGVLNEEGTLIVYTCTVCGKTKNEEVIPPYFGLGGKFDISATDKEWDDLTKRYVVEFLAGLSQDDFKLDLMGSGSGGERDFNVFVRDGIIFVGNGIEDMEIADLSQIKDQLDKFEYAIIDLKSIISEASSAVQIPVYLKATLSLLQEPAVFNLLNSFTVGGYNYLSIESKADNGNTVTTYDFHKTVDNLLDKLIEVGNYIDANVNVETSTIKSLYNSQAVKTLLDPLFKEIDASDLEIVLTAMVDIVNSVLEQQGSPKFDIEIIEAGELSAYDYIGKYLDAEIEIKGQKIKLGEIKLKDAFGEFYAQQDGTAKLADVMEESKEYLDSIIPVLKFSYTTEGVSAEVGKLLGIDFELKVNTSDEYEDGVKTHSTYVNYDFDLVYDKDAFVGFKMKGDIDETDSEFGNSTVDIETSILPTENGYEVKFKTETNDDYSSNDYVLDFVANFNVYFDADGDFEKFEVIVDCKENNKTLFDLDSFVAVGYEGEGENKKFKDFEIEVVFGSYFKDGEKDTSFEFETFVDCTYENDLLTQVDFSMGYENVIHAHNDGFSYSRGESSNSMLFTSSLKCTYNEDGLLTNAIVSVGEMGDLLAFDIAYAEGTENVSNIKAYIPNSDFAQLEIKFEYDDKQEVSKVEFVVDFIMPGSEGEDGEDVLAPYNAQLKLSMAPVYEGEEVTGIKGELYYDTRSDKFEGTFEFYVYGEEPEFIELPEIKGNILTLQSIMEMFGFGGVTDGPEQLA